MAKNSFKKKKAYQAANRQMARKGMINRADGVFIVTDSSKSTDAHYLAGYRVGRN